MVQFFLTCEICDGLLMTGGEEKHLKYVHHTEIELMSEDQLEALICKHFRLVKVPSDDVQDGSQ